MPSAPWPANPQILEINTWTWLHGLSQKYGRPITLANIPPADLEDAARYSDAVWLMGVWERSPLGREIALQHPGLQEEYRRALPDFEPQDVAGSPYSVRRYRVDPRLGGPQGLASARARLAERGVRLLLDFVPNHVAIDHDWTSREPSYFISGTLEEQSARPDHFFLCGDRVYAFGRDPYCPPWTDTAQINAFLSAPRQALCDTLLEIVTQCDGVRCDMAMLVTNEVFARTWGARAGRLPPEEFWVEIIGKVRTRCPDFLFVAEVYWDMEWVLQQQGFDFCYDKRLYDRMAHQDADAIRAHLSAGLDYQTKLLRFIENHDEARAAVVFGERRARAAAILALTLPGARLVHEGQSRGHRVRVPVQLDRRPLEPDNPDMIDFYHRLLAAARSTEIRQGSWRLCRAKPDQLGKHPGLITYLWEAGQNRQLIIVNFSDTPGYGRIFLDDVAYQGRMRFRDAMSDRTYDYDEGELSRDGVNVALPAWSGHVFAVCEAE